MVEANPQPATNYEPHSEEDQEYDQEYDIEDPNGDEESKEPHTAVDSEADGAAAAGMAPAKKKKKAQVTPKTLFSIDTSDSNHVGPLLEKLI